MLFWKAIFLGLIQGLTEFLPISSTGHLILAEKLAPLGDKLFSDAFFTIIQLGSILAVVLYFFSEIKRLFLLLWQKEPAAKNMGLCSPWLILLAVVPALVIGGLFGGMIQEALYSPKAVATALLLGGIVILLIEGRKETQGGLALEQMGRSHSLWIGLAQCVAMIPGVSRSAATIMGGRLTGLSRRAAVVFSFYLAIPTMCAATAYSFLKGVGHLSGVQWGAIAIGLLTAFLSSWAVVALLMRFIRSHSLQFFGWYRIILGGILLYFFR